MLSPLRLLVAVGNTMDNPSIQITNQKQQRPALIIHNVIPENASVGFAWKAQHALRIRNALQLNTVMFQAPLFHGKLAHLAYVPQHVQAVENVMLVKIVLMADVIQIFHANL